MNPNDPRLQAYAQQLGVTRFDLLGRLSAVESWLDDGGRDPFELFRLVYDDISTARTSSPPTTGAATKVPPENKIKMREEYSRGGTTLQQLADRYGCSVGTVRTAVKGVTKGEARILTPEEIEQTKRFLNPSLEARPNGDV